MADRAACLHPLPSHPTHPAADTKTRDRQVAIMLVFSTALMVVGAVGTLGDLSQGSLKTLWGVTANSELRRLRGSAE